MDFAELTCNAPANLARRLTSLADPPLALHYTGTDEAEKGLVEMNSWVGLNVQLFSRFAVSGRGCYVHVVDYPDKYAWVVRGLKAAHWRISLETWQDGMLLFSSTPGDNARASDIPSPAAERAR